MQGALTTSSRLKATPGRKPTGSGQTLSSGRDRHPRHRALLVPPALYEAIAHVPVLIDGPPQGGALLMHGDAPLVPVPWVARAGAPPPALRRILGAAWAPPVPDSFGRDESTTDT